MVKLYAIEKHIYSHKHPNGLIIASKDQLRVACEGGYINIKEIQLPGKRKMDVKPLLNGFQFSELAKLL